MRDQVQHPLAPLLGREHASKVVHDLGVCARIFELAQR